MKGFLVAAGLILIAAAPLLAQPAALGSLPAAPWFDPARGSIRGILGWAGSARMTEGVIDGLTAGSVAPFGKNAVVRTGGQWNWAALSSEAPSLDPMDDVPETVDSIDWSSDGRCAALVTAPATVKRVCAEADGRRTDVSMRVEGAERAVLSRTGRWLAMTVRSGDQIELWLADMATNDVRPIFGACPAAMSFAAKRDTLFFVDCRTRELFEVSSLAAGAAPAPTGITDAEGPASFILETFDPDVLALVRPDGRTAALVSRRERAVVSDFWFHERIGGIQRLSDGVYLALPKVPGGLLQLVDFARDEKVFFVPAAD